MSIIIFHRSHTKRGGTLSQEKPFDVKEPSNGQNFIANENGSIGLNESKKDRVEGLSEFKYEIKEVDKKIRITLQAKYLGKISLKEVFYIPLIPWSLMSAFYQPSSGKVEVVDSTSLSTSRSHIENTPANFIARIVTTDTETLIYLRGRIPNIQGYKNIIVDDDMDSARAFKHYSSKIKHFMDGISERRKALGKIDVYKQIGYLEAQIDILTEIIIKNGLAMDKQIRVLLDNASKNAVHKNLTTENLQKRFEYKKFVRQVDNSY